MYKDQYEIHRLNRSLLQRHYEAVSWRNHLTDEEEKDYKVCSSCRKFKLIKDEFHTMKRTYRNKTYTYYHSKCKECKIEEQRKYREKRKFNRSNIQAAIR